jgi:hypothetical protein
MSCRCGQPLSCTVKSYDMTWLSVMVGEPPVRVVDYGAVVAGSQTRGIVKSCGSQVLHDHAATS